MPASIPPMGDGRRVRVGLLGGSFNPAHQGHRGIALRARHALRLDQVWLMVSPGNPLKPRAGMAPLAERLASAAAIADGKRMIATSIEERLGTRYALDTVRALQLRFPRVHFVWIMGADVFAELPRWRLWKRFVRAVPIVVLPRPGSNNAALHGAASQRLARFRLPQRMGFRLADMKPPVWTFLSGPQNGISATGLRQAANSSRLSRVYQEQKNLSP